MGAAILTVSADRGRTPCPDSARRPCSKACVRLHPLLATAEDFIAFPKKGLPQAVTVEAANSAVLLPRTVGEATASMLRAVIAAPGNIAALPPQAVVEEIMPTPRVVTAEAGDSAALLHPAAGASVVGSMATAAEANLTAGTVAMAGAVKSN